MDAWRLGSYGAWASLAAAGAFKGDHHDFVSTFLPWARYPDHKKSSSGVDDDRQHEAVEKQLALQRRVQRRQLERQAQEINGHHDKGNSG